MATYLRGELYTYSLQLLQAYLAFLQLLQARQRSLPREILEYTVRQYGFADLDAFDITCGRYSPYDRAAVGPALL